MGSSAYWSKERSRRIAKRIVIEGDLILQTPTHFGDGDSSDESDMPLLLDAYDGSPLLTGSSLAGALRSYLRSYEKGNRVSYPNRDDTDDVYKATLTRERESLAAKLFGGFRMDDEGRQSPLIVEDSFGKAGSDTLIGLRNGVKLNSETRTAEDKALYNMQVWQAGTIFPLRLELLVCDPHPDPAKNAGWADEASLRQALAVALDGLSNGEIMMGTRKRRGFGQIRVPTWHVKTFNMKQPAHLFGWLENGASSLTEQSNILSGTNIFTLLNTKKFVDNREWFAMNVTLGLSGSLLIRSGGGQDDLNADMVHLTNHKGDPILSGTTVAGALRQRARRILNIVRPTDDQFLDDLFGHEETGDNAKASRLIVEETEIKEPQFDLVQNRVAIDRFTGGALDSALFNEQPVFGNPQTRLFVNLRVINPIDADIGLLLLLLKDLWTEDLPLGGEISVGRGRLKGDSATLQLKRQGSELQKWAIRQEGDQLAIDNAHELEEFVEALWSQEDKA